MTPTNYHLCRPLLHHYSSLTHQILQFTRPPHSPQLPKNSLTTPPPKMPFFLFIPPTPLRNLDPPNPHRTLSPIRACTSAPTPAPPPTPAEIDTLFSRLSHINKNLRRKASIQLSEIATPDTISRLSSLLCASDTSHRRAAVQALGMTGLPALPTILARLDNDSNITVRSSCVKVLAAIALYYPQERATFPSEALDLLETIVENPATDPVTKISTIGCLGTLGCDVRDRDRQLVHHGSERAVGTLLKLCTNADMAIASAAVGAAAQVAQNASPQLKAVITSELRTLITDEDPDDPDAGFNYASQMAASHLEQLESGNRIPPQDQT